MQGPLPHCLVLNAAFTISPCVSMAVADTDKASKAANVNISAHVVAAEINYLLCLSF